MAANHSQTASSGTGLCPGSSLFREVRPYGDCLGAVTMLLSAVSCKWGRRARRRQGLRRGREAATGRPRTQGTGGARRPGSGCCGLAGLQDYSARHAPRRASLRACGSGGLRGSSGAVCGSRGQREWGAFPALARDVSAESLDVRTGRNLRTSSPLVGSSKDKETASAGGSAYPGPHSWAVQECSEPKTALFPAPG